MNKVFTSYTLKAIDAPNFIMSPVELRDYIPFEVKRIYYITRPKTGFSGEHCHFVEEEMFIMIQGTGTIIIDQGNGKEEIPMEGPTSGFYVPNYVWHGFKNLSSDAIILALSSTNYSPDRSDYLEDYEKYLPLRDEHLKKES